MCVCTFEFVMHTQILCIRTCGICVHTNIVQNDCADPRWLWGCPESCAMIQRRTARKWCLKQEALTIMLLLVWALRIMGVLQTAIVKSTFHQLPNMQHQTLPQRNAHVIPCRVPWENHGKIITLIMQNLLGWFATFGRCTERNLCQATLFQWWP